MTVSPQPPHPSSDAQFRRIVEASLHGVVIQQSGSIVYANAAMAVIFGFFDAQEMLGISTFDDFVAEKERPLLRSRTAAVYRGEPIKPHPGWRGSSKDGGEIWVSSTAQLTDWQGQPAVVSFYFDITARKIAEQQLAQSEARLSGLVDQANDAIISIDAQQRITLLNHGAVVIFGYEPTEAIGQPLDLLIPKRDHTAHREHIEAFSRGTQASRRMGERAEIFGRRKDGSEFPAEASISRQDLASGPIFTAILRDITDRKRQQEELEVRVAERTRDLQDEIRRREAAQAALVQAQRMDALGQLTGGVAHDSNNLLTVITGNLEMVEDELGDHPTMKYVREAQEAAQMGARLNQRLLTFARRRKLEPQVINLNDHVLSMSELLRRSLGETINLTTVLMHDLWPVRTDPSEVENAVLNLAINARDASPKGGNLQIETQNVAFGAEAVPQIEGLDAGDYVRLSVSDNGIGMSPEIQRRVFEPFFTTKEPGKGTGLGLSSLYGFAKQSKGHVTIYSEVGRGTTVNVYLPRVQTGEARSAANSADKPPAQAKGETILVVEDNSQVRTLTLERLKRLGFSTLEAENGPAALAILDQRLKVDLVFSDVVMPGGMSGFELARAIRERWPGLRILLTSGFAEDVARSGVRAIDDQRILRKPYSQAELAQTLREALDA